MPDLESTLKLSKITEIDFKSFLFEAIDFTRETIPAPPATVDKAPNLLIRVSSEFTPTVPRLTIPLIKSLSTAVLDKRCQEDSNSFTFP